MHYGKLSEYPIRSEPKSSYGFDRVSGQLTLQAKAIQTLEELCQAAPNPSPLGTLHLFFPITCLGFYRNMRNDITRTDDEVFYETTN